MGKTIFSLLLPGCCLIVFFSCQTQEGAVEGMVVPPLPGMRVTVNHSGTAVRAVGMNVRDGKFRIALAPGKYDVSAGSVSSPFPITVAGVDVDPGKTLTLPPSEMTLPSGTAAISGTVSPGGPMTKVTLLQEGKERASVTAAPDGRYEFTALPAGKYILAASSPGYASDVTEVRISGSRRVAQNIRLLYVSPIDGVDWTRGVIRARGRGLYPSDSLNRTAMHEMAKRAALSDAERNLLGIIEQIKLDSNHDLKSAMASGTFTTRIKGYLRGFRIVGEHDVNDGVEIELELPLTGPDGLTRYIPN